MKKSKRKLTLDQAVTYQIKVPGELDGSWSDWIEEMTLSVATDETGSPVTILTGNLDQAGLQGVLRRLYSIGVPLISVNYVEPEDCCL